MAEEYDKLAKQQSKNKRTLWGDVSKLQKASPRTGVFQLQGYGVALAREKRILTEEDVEKLLFEGR